MRVKWLSVPRGLCVAAIIVGVLATGTASLAAEAEWYAYGANVPFEVKVAIVYVVRGEFEDALKWVDLALARNPQNVELNVVKASCLSALGRLEEAVEYYDRVIELEPDVWLRHYEKADILVKLGRFEEAVDSYDQALSLFDIEHAAESYDRAAMLTYRGYTHLEHVIYQKKIKALKELGALEGALETREEALARDTAASYLYRDKARILMALGRYEEAARNLVRAADTGLECATSYVEQAEEYLRDDDYEKALLFFDAALAADADDYYAWRSKGKTLLYAGETEGALRCLERALELHPESTEVWPLRGAAYFMEDKYAQARAAFESCLAFDGYEYVLLYLYVVDRAEGRAGAERLRPQLESQYDPWGRAIARFLAGEIGAEDLLTSAGADKYLRCEGHYYIGYKNKLDGDAAAARRHFEEAAATKDHSTLEYIFSLHELRRLEAAGE